jgi:hypothetical protein
MAEKGVLEGSQMAGTFDMLRANDLIFNYVVSNWLMGQDPPAFDILAWNGDSTRMPTAMHSFYLRSLYMRTNWPGASWNWPARSCRWRTCAKSFALEDSAARVCDPKNRDLRPSLCGRCAAGSR